ncbi:cytochrome P450 [Neolentinus lepideus HHB14362 ss-1]|uniref:Cytochrome P450 n=1 Tax=Neolentinus lepideus HHB14362 ss-1 TaxID=1314782 RepID=A0A165UTS0_9AGAM|nr:cytochrome P450 [Neolentinus lepideus HHB14362 ss-1]
MTSQLDVVDSWSTLAFHPIPVLYAACSGLIAIALLLKYCHARSCSVRYPPGPTPHPLFGHTFQIPKQHTWRYLEGLGKRYGPIVRLSLAGDNLLVLNDPEDAEELLGRRSHNYSSRKSLIYAGKYQSSEKRLVLLPYGPRLRTQRAAFYQMLQPQVVGSYETIQELESIRLLHDMLTRPHEMELNTKRFAAGNVFHLSYGRHLAHNDEDLKSVLGVLDGFIRDCYPGAHLVDIFPMLDRLPDFLSPWRIAALRKHDMEMKASLRSRVETGDESDCFAARLWQDNHMNHLDTESLAYIAGSAFEAGTDTTAATIMWFVMAMILYPDTLKKAQAEIDAVVGSEGKTIPGFSHFRDLPYTTCLTKEVFRWMPAAPGGFPHFSDKDDTYKGYRVDAKTMVIPNIWAMQHNEHQFPDPLVFNPDRFMKDNDVPIGPDSLTEGHYGFGFGRRICPGRHLGAKTVWIGIVRLIWGFNFLAETHPHGINPECCTSGITCKPERFPHRIQPRSQVHATSISDAWKFSSVTWQA